MSRVFSARWTSTSIALTLLASLSACRRAAAPATTPAPIEQSAAAPAPAPAPANDAPPAPATNTDADAERRARALLGQAVFFQYDQSDLDETARETLDAKIEILNGDASLQLRIEGHTDERGSDEYNMALAMRRATSVQRYLAGRGIAASRLEIVSLGEERPTCREANDACWQQNRRAEFVVNR